VAELLSQVPPEVKVDELVIRSVFTRAHHLAAGVEGEGVHSNAFLGVFHPHTAAWGLQTLQEVTRLGQQEKQAAAQLTLFAASKKLLPRSSDELAAHPETQIGVRNLMH
jgi:hypothetical protein